MLTVILCTYNRCQNLARAMESIAVSILPDTIEWEVLVVDNNSSDQTAQVVRNFCSRNPSRFRYLLEPRQGKSYALNAGIREARGDVLAFVDDDVTVESKWLHNLTSPLHNHQWAGCGGRILPEPGFVPPRWLALNGPCNLVGALCAYFDLGKVPGELKTPPFGANMAFRREMFAKYGDFRTDLGIFAQEKIGFEDTEFGRRLLAGGERLWYAPTAVVYHEVPDYRVRKEFLLAWWFDFGRGAVRETEKGLGLWGVIKTLGRTSLTGLEWLLSFNPQRRFYRKCRAWYGAGKIMESFRQPASANSREHKFEAAGNK
jgi:glycosyltransferase involved in cell wall biosynthesis